MHPNAYGQQALGLCLTLVAIQPRDIDNFACRPGPSRGIEAMQLYTTGGPPRAARRMVDRARPKELPGWVPDVLELPPPPANLPDHLDEPPPDRD
jgi:hypothetical protein